MDGIHDLGGRQGFGRVRFTKNAKAFHEPWELRANALYGFAVRLGLINGELISMSSDICKQVKAVRLEASFATRSRLSQRTPGEVL